MDLRPRESYRFLAKSVRTKNIVKNGSPIQPIAHRMKNRVKVKARLDPVAKIDFKEFSKIASTFRNKIAGIP